jgi:hypothetical protein
MQPYDTYMILKRIHIAVTPAQLRLIDKLSQKLQLDRSSVLRLSLARLAELENVKI